MDELGLNSGLKLGLKKIYIPFFEMKEFS